MNRTIALKNFGLEPDRPVVAILGGSQGSTAINGAVSAALGDLTTKLKVQVLWQTGRKDFEELSHLKESYPGVKILSFVENMGAFYSAADLIISRAGAMALAEITFCGKPSILIPFPRATADHQTKNAEGLVQAGAAIHLPENELSPTRLVDEVKKILATKQTHEEMGLNAKSISFKNSSEKIVQQILLATER
ncbi:MAG: UDP-N-acetylglucosamine--N-acetylmuramyl-(pentapeptide) pyrophosphoryl-undecaprenol N-acetylglucosamine transferase [Candidatus Marinimicrobia bacterium]|nr:UDP-N-acetylglucosamine--N-acetylmuramyl-(pentapeptide) pyrophosphoryl-undecaprenol N-acetylglucosamine transferase [Candidatus Neomarinimicrobiota bacterium]